MGLITGILALPLAPVRGTVAIADQILRQAEEMFYDPAGIRSELEQVERMLEAGQIDEPTATAWEDELIERLMIGQERTGRG